MQPTNQPQVKLKGIEYLLLAIQADPGKSQRHYLRRLYKYQHDFLELITRTLRTQIKVFCNETDTSRSRTGERS